MNAERVRTNLLSFGLVWWGESTDKRTGKGEETDAFFFSSYSDLQTDNRLGLGRKKIVRSTGFVWVGCTIYRQLLSQLFLMDHIESIARILNRVVLCSNNTQTSHSLVHSFKIG